MSQSVEPNDELEEERDDAVIAVAIRYSLYVYAGLIFVTVLGTFLWMWRRSGPTIAEIKPVDLAAVWQRTERPLPAIRWTDITAKAGICFEHVNGAAGEKLLPETMGGGCEFLDYNGDGAPDILFVNSKHWAHDPTSQDVEVVPTLVLYENDGTGHFRDVTEEVGLNVTIYGH